MFCPNCGKEIAENSKFCGECGKPIQDPPLNLNTPAEEKPAVPGSAKSSTKKKGCLGCLGIIILLVVLAAIFGSSHNSSQPSATNNQGAAAKAEQKKDLELIEHKWTNDTYSSYIEGAVKNNTNKQYKYAQVEINLYDDSGAQVGSTLANANNLEPNGTWKFKALVTQKNAKKYAIKNITAF